MEIVVPHFRQQFAQTLSLRHEVCLPDQAIDRIRKLDFVFGHGHQHVFDRQHARDIVQCLLVNGEPGMWMIGVYLEKLIQDCTSLNKPYFRTRPHNITYGAVGELKSLVYHVRFRIFPYAFRLADVNGSAYFGLIHGRFNLRIISNHARKTRAYFIQHPDKWI